MIRINVLRCFSWQLPSNTFTNISVLKFKSQNKLVCCFVLFSFCSSSSFFFKHQIKDTLPNREVGLHSSLDPQSLNTELPDSSKVPEWLLEHSLSHVFMRMHVGIRILNI